MRKTLGLALLACGEGKAAVEPLAEALAGGLPPGHKAATMVSYGQSLEAVGRLRNARMAFSEVLALTEEPEVAAAARAGLARIQDVGSSEDSP